MPALPPPVSRVREFLKRIAFRNEALAFLSAPSYQYNLEVAQLVFLVQELDRTTAMTGAIAEVGVARGLTTVFLTRHLDEIGDQRRYLALDTFSGFTAADVDHEVAARGKGRADFGVFGYNDVTVFRRNMQRLGLTRVDARQGDVGLLTPADVGLVSVVLLDVDLYRPTARALPVLYECLQPGGVIMVDDVIEHTRYDGAAQAYYEFVGARGLPIEIVAGKGGIIRKLA
ncbi:MAG TPA: TylF/MycF/NovP-related O-methyltransferase [Marisediminicola sp.]|jgi:predicted O-methyltransferase YrrM|nr:TylF/MycF/NovP-related O-methyltransferase [Marisediminicola sp.]